MIKQVVLIGFGAIGASVYKRIQKNPILNISHIVVPDAMRTAVAQQVATSGGCP